jgi:alpha-galactosidase/6-phospho-beta-glucosidase family protein
MHIIPHSIMLSHFYHGIASIFIFNQVIDVSSSLNNINHINHITSCLINSTNTTHHFKAYAKKLSLSKESPNHTHTHTHTHISIYTQFSPHYHYQNNYHQMVHQVYTLKQVRHTVRAWFRYSQLSTKSTNAHIHQST